MRGGFSVYSGWVTAATILNVSFVLKSWGMEDPNIPYLDEEQLTTIVLWVAFLIYNLYSYVERNPLYGTIYIWVVLAIKNRTVEEGNVYPMITDNVNYIAIIHGISMVALWAWLAAESYYDVDLIDGWNTGIFYQE